MTPDPIPGPASATLAGALGEERAILAAAADAADQGQWRVAVQIYGTLKVAALVAALEAVLKLADEWAAESDELDDLAEKPGTDEEGRPIMQGQALAYNSCVWGLREAITRELSGKEAQGG